MEGVTLTPLKIIPSPLGSVYHALKSHESSFSGFGEAYFSEVNSGVIKGWKKHTKMILNVVVPVGAIRFVLYDDREGSSTKGDIMEVELSKDNYKRLTVPPGIYMAFKGISPDTNLLLNLASIPHDPNEAVGLELKNNLIPYDWE